MKTVTFKTTTSIFIVMLFAVISLSAQKYDEQGFPVPGSITGPKYSTDSVACVTNFSLYRENYRQWRSSDYKNEAIDYTVDSWRFVFLNCPLASQNTYIDGSKIIEHLYNKTTDTVLRKAYLDTLMLMYDRRIMAFGFDPSSNEGFVLGRKGVELLAYNPDAFADAYKIFDRSVARAGNASESAVIYYYFLTTVRSVREGGADSTLIFDNYDKVSAIIDFNIKSLKKLIEENPAETEKNQRGLKGFETANGNVENLFEPFATCDNLVKIYTKKFEENPRDTAMIEKMLNAFDRKNCTPDIYFVAADTLYKLKPNATSALSLGKMYMKLEQYTKAIPFLQDAANGLTDNDAKGDAYYLIANAYKNLRNYSASRANALKAAELKPNDGKPWILIGDLYAMSAGSCGDNKVTQKAAYWAAVDKYVKARSVDESIAGDANSRIATYTSAFPSSEDIFFFGYKKGDSFRVECWINETTTVRSSD